MRIPLHLEKSSFGPEVELVGALGLVVLIAVGFLIGREAGRPLELMLIVLAVAIGYVAGPTRSMVIAPGAAVLFLAVEAAYGRFGASQLAVSLAYAATTAAAVLLAGRLRREQPGVAQDVPTPGTLEYELRRGLRHHHPFSLVVVHPDGREPNLHEIASMISVQLRTTDVVTRRSGRDFWVLLPETESDAARVVGERIRLAVGDDDRSVSIGSATFPEDGVSARDLSGAAQRALVRALELGGNRTVLASVRGDAPAGWGLPGQAA